MRFVAWLCCLVCGLVSVTLWSLPVEHPARIALLIAGLWFSYRASVPDRVER